MTDRSDTLDPKALDEALDQAHLPALLMSLVHLTGDASLLTQERWPEYVLMADGKLGGYSPEVQAGIRALAKAAITAFMEGAPLPPQPSPAIVRKMMDWIAGADIPDQYADFLTDELHLDGVDNNLPDWSSPTLKAAAKRMKVLVVGAGMSGLLTGIRLKQAGIDFTILEKNADAGGTWFENVYPGCRVDNPNHMYSYSFEPNHDFPQFYSTQPVLLDYFRRVTDRHGLRDHIRFGDHRRGGRVRRGAQRLADQGQARHGQRARVPRGQTPWSRRWASFEISCAIPTSRGWRASRGRASTPPAGAMTLTSPASAWR